MSSKKDLPPTTPITTPAAEDTSNAEEKANGDELLNTSETQVSGTQKEVIRVSCICNHFFFK